MYISLFTKARRYYAVNKMLSREQNQIVPRSLKLNRQPEVIRNSMHVGVEDAPD